jgi:ubiquinone biosynthesis protein COQ9
MYGVHALREGPEMLDRTTENGRILAAALDLAAERPWRNVTLAEIAAAAGTDLARVREHYAGKAEIVAAFMSAIDAETLRRAPPPTAGQPRRDALFEVVMARFDALTPYKAAVRSIARQGTFEPSLARPFLSAQHWMLEAAGIGADGPGGAVRIAGLASLYAAVFQTWLDDDDPGMARTMASLDRRIRRGETILSGAGVVCSVVCRLSEGLLGAARAAAAAAARRPARETASSGDETRAAAAGLGAAETGRGG